MIENERQREIEVRAQFVAEQFERVGLDIRNYPELFERFKRLHGPESSHFEDSVQMVRIIEVILDGLEEEFSVKIDKNQLYLATLLHDVGKSGPRNVTPEEQSLIITIFEPHHYQAIQQKGEKVEEMSIAQALQKSEMDPELRQKIINFLKKLDINCEEEKMIDLWRRHVDWTYEILSGIQDNLITPRVAIIAASHHILDGKNPANLDFENIPQEAKTIEIIEACEVLALVDKFQAYVKRSGLSHEEAIKVLHQIIDKQPISEKVKSDYRKILEVIDFSKDKLQNIF